MNAKIVILLALVIVGGVGAYFFLEDGPSSLERVPGGYIADYKSNLFSRYQMGEQECAEQVKKMQAQGVKVGAWDINGYAPKGDCHILSPEQLAEGTVHAGPVPKGKVRVAYIPRGHSVVQ